MRRVAGVVVLAVVAAAAALVVITTLTAGLEALWSEDSVWGEQPPLPFILLAPAVAGGCVAYMRTRWANGHDPMVGIALGPTSIPDFVGILLAVFISLFGGAVLGPEAALVITGAAIGTALGPRLGLELKQSVTIGGLSAILVLLVPLAQTSNSLKTGYDYSLSETPAVLLGVALTLAVLSAVRLGARWIGIATHDETPVVWRVAVAGLVMGIIGVVFVQVTELSVNFALTSGEGALKHLTQLDSVSLILSAVAAKSLAYAISMGAGFRGGPFFPAMFIGAGMGAVAAGVLGVSPGAAAAAGLLAATTHLAQMKWKGSVVTGVLLGYAIGGWELIPASLVGALLGPLVPRIASAEPERQSADSTA